MEDAIQQVIESLSAIENDQVLPKNVRVKVKTVMDMLMNKEKNASLRVDQSLETLNDLCDDPNLQPYIRMQLWNVVSQLASK